MEGSSNATGATGATGGIPLNVTLHAWPVPPLHDHASHASSSNTNASLHRLHNLNATGFVAIEDDATDTGFTDVQTLILAGIATLIPLIIAVGTVFVARLVWHRYRERKGEGYEGVLQREESSEPLSKIQAHSLPPELKASESQFTVTPGEEGASSTSPQLLTPKSNGSVITMTLKNNHLIVETEETTDSLNGIKIESKGTTTKYLTPSAMDVRGEGRTTPEGAAGGKQTAERDHGALVHRPADEEPEDRACNTGLSQSDLSMSSSGSNNPSYRYGNQSGYDAGGYGYPDYTGYSTLVDRNSYPGAKGAKANKAFVRSPSQLMRTDSVISNCEVTSPRLQDVLMSDIQARALIKTRQAEEDRLQNEQQVLGNGHVTPDKKSPSRRSSDAAPEAAAVVAAAADKKRASLPTFAPLGGVKGSRFEQLKNEMSPVEEIEKHPGCEGVAATTKTAAEATLATQATRTNSTS